MDDLLDADRNCPMFVISGDADLHIPITDTQIFEGRRDTDVQLVHGAGHCGFDQIDVLLAGTNAWLNTVMHEPATTTPSPGPAVVESAPGSTVMTTIHEPIVPR
jgi:hypothetical protein